MGSSVVGSLDKEAAALDAARSEREAALPKGAKPLAAAEKKLAKAAASLAAATRSAIAQVPEGKEGKAALAEGASLLPERRKRQPRTFPSVTADSPIVVFAWRGADPPVAVRAALDAIASRVGRLGHSSSLVSLRLRDMAPPPNWIPAEEGELGAGDETVLRVVEPGQLQALRKAFELLGDAPGRVMPASFRRYIRPLQPGAPAARPSAFEDQWIVLRRLEGPRLPSTRAVDVARTLRRALMSAHGPDAPEILTGHRTSGESSQRPHLAFVPLPFLGHERADGTILGVALVLPREASREERRAVFHALDRWERAAREDDEDTPRLPIFLGKAGTLWIERVDGEASIATLRPTTWCAPALSWASATPVALDRNPGDLHSSNAAKEKAAYIEAEASVATACERIGLPPPARVTVMPAAPLAGGDKARQFPPFKVDGGVQRVLVHATLVFNVPVRGPILLGAGRYFGLGLFRPLRDHG